MSNTAGILSETGITYRVPVFTPSPGLFDGVRVIYLLFSAVLISFVCVHPLSCVSNIACVSILSILDCPFGFL
jgi:thiosulfate reductase cytochrome b subunit